MLISGSRTNNASPIPGTSSGVTANSGLELMVRQVKEVLPHVPVDVIKTNLGL